MHRSIRFLALTALLFPLAAAADIAPPPAKPRIEVAFVLGDDLIVRKFKLLDGAVDELESTDRDDIRAELDARFALMSAEVKRLFAVLESALKLSKADG